MAMTELHEAARSNLLQRARFLMSEGSDVNARDGLARTPLHILGLNNYNDDFYELAEALLKNGADPTVNDSQGNSPIYYLIKDGGVRIVSLLLNSCKLRVCIPDGSSVDILPDDQPEDLRLHEYEGCFLLGVAAYHNNLEVLQMLLQKLPRVLLEHRNESGQTALHIAMKKNVDGSHAKVIKLLLDYGARIDLEDNEGHTPIKYLFKRHEFKCLEPFFNFTWNAANVVPNFTGEEIREADFELLLAHTHFGEIFFNETSFEGLRRLPWFFGSRVVKHLAKFNINGDDILDGILRNVINERDRYIYFYHKCHREARLNTLETVENTEISFYSLLMGYAEQMPDDVLFAVFSKRNWRWSFPIYGTIIEENVEQELKKRGLVN